MLVINIPLNSALQLSAGFQAAKIQLFPDTAKNIFSTTGVMGRFESISVQIGTEFMYSLMEH